MGGWQGKRGAKCDGGLHTISISDMLSLAKSANSLFVMPSTRFKQAIPDLELSIERATDQTPTPSKFYLFYKGKTIGVFGSLKAAQVRYREIIAESGYKPRHEANPKSASEVDIDRYLDAKESYWASSYKHRGGGGRGGRGGV